MFHYSLCLQLIGGILHRLKGVMSQVLHMLLHDWFSEGNSSGIQDSKRSCHIRFVLLIFILGSTL